MNSEQCMNSKIKILEGYSCAKRPSLAILTFHTFACKLAGKKILANVPGKLKHD